MGLNDSFWKHFELDLQEVKLSYLNWAIGYAREPKREYRHLFLWDHQDRFCVINSRYGRSFSFSPFGPGVRGAQRPKYKCIPRGLDEIDLALKARMTEKTGYIRSAITDALETGHLDDARQMVLNFYWLKLGAHELLFDRTQLKYDEHGKVKKGRWGLDESERWHTLSGTMRCDISGHPYWNKQMCLWDLFKGFWDTKAERPLKSICIRLAIPSELQWTC